MVINLPYNYSPREYQKPLWQAFFDEKKRHLVCVWHRRAGKDKTCLNLTIVAAIKTVGSYYYLFPELKQARRDIWEGMGKDGFRFIDHFPPSLIKKINNTEMMIELVNGSMFRLCGADRYDALMGSNPIGVVYSEYALQNPRCRDFLLPILAENKGWELFQYTPRGQNHGYELYQTALNNPDWFCEVLPVTTTKRPDNSPVITDEMIEEVRQSGMSDDMIQQEFYCSFNAAVRGAYFSRQLARAYDDNQVYDFPIDRTIPVNTYWDIGYHDPTAIWFMQPTMGKYYAIWYYENNFEDLQHYINYLEEIKKKFGIVYGQHYAPHDSRKTEYGSGLTIKAQAAKMGLNFNAVPRIQHKQDAIEMARSFFNKVVFHSVNTKAGLDCLREYHAKYNERMNVYSDHPEHNWASHGTDAFLTFVQHEYFDPQRIHGTQIFDRVATRPILT